MDGRKNDESNGVLGIGRSNSEGNNLGSTGEGSLSSNGMVRADQIDLSSLDIQLDGLFARLPKKALDTGRPREDWEIDLSKLELKHVVAHGTYGTVYRGTYEDQDVAGVYIVSFYFQLSIEIAYLMS